MSVNKRYEYKRLLIFFLHLVNIIGIARFLGLVHTMPDKFENATLLLRLGLPSTLQRTYPHKKICENGTF